MLVDTIFNKLYVGLSGVTSSKGLNILIHKSINKSPYHIKNIVHKEILQNINTFLHYYILNKHCSLIIFFPSCIVLTFRFLICFFYLYFTFIFLIGLFQSRNMFTPIRILMHGETHLTIRARIYRLW